MKAMSQRKRPKRWTGVLWAAWNQEQGRFGYGNSNAPFLTETDPPSKDFRYDETPVRVRVTITPLPARRRKGGRG